jgi:hypothetical protein
MGDPGDPRDAARSRHRQFAYRDARRRLQGLQRRWEWAHRSLPHDVLAPFAHRNVHIMYPYAVFYGAPPGIRYLVPGCNNRPLQGGPQPR